MQLRLFLTCHSGHRYRREEDCIYKMYHENGMIILVSDSVIEGANLAIKITNRQSRYLVKLLTLAPRMQSPWLEKLFFDNR